MLSYPSTISLSTTTLRYVTQMIRGHRRRIGSVWRKLCPSRQALLVLAHLRNGDTYARLAGGFGVGVATVYRYIRETVELLATHASTLTAAVWRLAWTRHNYAILDGTVIRIDRIAADRPYYSGKHRHHGINLQALTDPHGELLWISEGLPGAVNDTKAARQHRIPDTTHAAGLMLLADSGYDSVANYTTEQITNRTAESVITPYKARRNHPKTPGQRAANTALARVRGPGERGFATLKNWHILRRVRSCPRRVGTLAQAVLTLEHHPNP